MISAFGKVMRDVRNKAGDSLRTCASKLEITPAFLSSMEIGRKSIPTYYPEKIKNLYNLSHDEYISLYNAMIETNKHVDIEIEKMNEAQKEVSMTFARKIENADPELVEKLRKVLMESDDQN